MVYILLFFTIISNVIAQITLKKGVSLIEFGNEGVKNIVGILLSPYIWLGLILYGLSFLLYLGVLSKTELSKAAPITQSLTILLIVLFSVLFLGEPLSIGKVLGIILIFIGVFLIF
ncbi:EamA family transporter [Paenibacillus sp. PsM32]|uniref:EamA family transporter n=1 Tax=Paenibacillus sp. PsM32 TaxID=3030536 RepID=UPI00263B01B9|nr:EamA family transporter [Paenibacillus sp. PsM32]MDN4620694.1 EamA family transporter [Paenibacillus sp. PsM32]